MKLRRLFVLIAASAALLVSGCSIENVMFVEEPDSASSKEDVTPIAKVRGQSSTSWSMEPPSALDDVLVEEARRDALEQVPQGQVILDPVVDMETMQIPMGLATLYSTKVFMEGIVGKTDAELNMASDHEADEYAAEDKMMADADDPMKDTGAEDDSEMKDEAAKEMTESADAMTTKGEDERAEGKDTMAKAEDGNTKNNSWTPVTKDEDVASKDSSDGQDTMAKDDDAQDSEMKEEAGAEKMMSTLRKEEPAARPGPPFGSAEYAEACGIQVDIPDSYGLVYVRTSKSVPLQIMSAAAYIQLLKNLCPATIGGGS